MTEPYLGEIRMIAGNFAPAQWLFCEGQQIFISQYQDLFQLIGTTYGGDGQTFFALPDLRGRVPIHNGQGAGLSFRNIGESDGSEVVTLTVEQMPSHNHLAQGVDNPGGAPSPGDGIWAGSISEVLYRFGPVNGTTPMNIDSVSLTGGGKPHENVAPFQCVNFIISVFGAFPSQG